MEILEILVVIMIITFSQGGEPLTAEETASIENHESYYSPPTDAERCDGEVFGGGIVVDDMVMCATSDEPNNPIVDIKVLKIPGTVIVLHERGCNQSLCITDLSSLGSGSYNGVVILKDGKVLSAAFTL